MTIQRKKITLDGIDREILRLMSDSRRALTGREISRSVGISPPAIRPRLNNLEKKGIVRQDKCGGMRKFERKFGNKTKTIRAPSRMCWRLDFKDER